MQQNSYPWPASVIICVRNGAKVITKQLDALAAQCDAPPFELIVVDHKSTDGTLDVVRGWAVNRGLGAISKMRITTATAREGIPYPRNVGATLAEGAVLLFCDADDQVSPLWVRSFVDAGVDAGGGRIVAHDADGAPHPATFPDGLIQTRYLPHISCCNVAIRRDIYFEVGGFDESLPNYGFEDVDISWRIQEAGYQLTYVPAALIDFTLSPPSKALRKKWLLGQGRVLMARRYPQYDSRSYSISSCTADAARHLGLLALSMVRTGVVNRNAVRDLITSSGRLYASVKYRVMGYPPPRLISTPRVNS